MKKPRPGVNGWYRIVGRFERDDLWIGLEFDGPEELRDGRWLEREVAFGRGDLYPAKWWFRQNEASTGRSRPDVLWGGVVAFCIVSKRFINAIENLGVTGWQTYPITLLDRADVPIDGYVGFIGPLALGQGLTTGGWDDGTPSFDFFVTERVLDGLLAAGVDRFDLEPAEAEWAPPPYEGPC